MKNKYLETMLTKNSLHDVVKVLERCEQGLVEEIAITDKDGMTGVEEIDKELYQYLDKLGIKVVFVDKNRNQSMEKIEIKIYKEKQKICNNNVHTIVAKRKKKENKSKELRSSGYGLFKIDENCFVACPDCYEIHKIL